MWLIATTVTLFIANVLVMAGGAEILDRKPTDDCGSLDCGLWFCTRSTANRIQYVTGSSMQQGKLATFTCSPSVMLLCSEVI